MTDWAKVVDRIESSRPVLQTVTVPEEPEDDRSEFGKGLKAGFYQTAATVPALVSMGAKAVGADSLAKGAAESAAALMEKAPAPETTFGELLEDPSLEGATNWMLYTGGTLLPTMLAGATGAGVGAKIAGKYATKKAVKSLIAKSAEKEIAKGVAKDVAIKNAAMSLGAKAGMVGAVAPMEAGHMYMTDVEQHGVENASPGKAAVMGTAAGAMEVMFGGGHLRLINRIFGKNAGRAAGKALAAGESKAVGRALKEAVIQGGGEGLQELTQEELAILNEIWTGEDQSLFEKKNLLRAGESFAAGALMGGPTGAVTGLVKPNISKDGPTDTKDTPVDDPVERNPIKKEIIRREKDPKQQAVEREWMRHPEGRQEHIDEQFPEEEPWQKGTAPKEKVAGTPKEGPVLVPEVASEAKARQGQPDQSQVPAAEVVREIPQATAKKVAPVELQNTQEAKEPTGGLGTYKRGDERKTIYGMSARLSAKDVSGDKHLNKNVIPAVRDAMKDHMSKGRAGVNKVTGADQSTDVNELPATADFVIASRKPPKYKGHVIRQVDEHIIKGDEVDLRPPSSDYTERTIAFVNDDGSVDAVTLGKKDSFGGIAAMKQLKEKGGSDLTHGSKLDLTGIREVYVFDLDHVHGSNLDIFRRRPKQGGAAKPAKTDRKAAKLSTNKGTGISAEDVESYFTKRGFQVARDGDSVTVSTPSGQINVHVKDSVVDDDGVTIRLSYGREPKTGEKVAGSYFDGTIKLRQDLADTGTLDHELFHHMKKAKLFNAAEERILARKGDEEAQARWIESELRERSAKGIPGKLIQKVADFIDAIVNSFKRTERGVVREIESGNVLKRKKGPPDGTKTAVELSTKVLGTDYALPETRVDQARAAMLPHFNNLMYWAVDKNRPIQSVQNMLGKVSNKIDVFLKETQRPKRTAAHVQRVWDNEIEPLIKKMSEYGVELQDLELYAHAMHAHEANAALRRANAKMQVEKIINALGANRQIEKARELKAEVKGLEKPAEWLAALEMSLEKYGNETDVDLIKNNWEEFSENPSGMTDEDASEVLKEYKGNKNIEKLRLMLSDINSNRLDLLYNAGQIPTEEYKAIKSKYRNYVPLYREGYGDKLYESSRGLKPSGRAVKVRGGSTRNVVNILANSVSQYEKAINVAEKARSQRALLGLVKANPGSSILHLEPVPKSPRHDKNGNIRMYPDLFKVDDTEMRLMVDGKQYLLSVKRDNKDAMLMLKTLKAEDNMSGPIMNTLAKVNRFLAKVNTTWSPEFIISNLVRDLQTAGINIQGTGVKGKGMLKGAGRAIRAIYAVERGKPKNTELEKLYDRFKRAGGKIGWSDVHGSVENLSKKIKKDLDALNGKRPARTRIKQWLDWVEDANTSIENGVRLHAFKLATEQFKKKNPDWTQAEIDEKAAQMASDLTVDFTKKGAAGPVINSLYLFANAGIQGSYRILRATKSKKVRATLAGIVSVGFLSGLLNSLAGEDEDGEDYFNKIEEYVRERNAIFMIPGTNGRYAKIPLPWGYNFVWNVGVEASRAFTKEDYDPMESGGRLISTFANAFNPVSSGTLLQTLAPTIADPFVQVAENKNWFGGDLMPNKNPFEKVPTPDSQRYWRSTGATSKWVAEMLNDLTGGDKVEKGFIDVSPETLDLISDSIGGSALRFAKDTFGFPMKVLREEEIQVHNVPFFRRVAGQQSEWANSRIYYNNLEDVLTVKEQLKTYKGTEYEKDIIKAKKKQRLLIPLAERLEKKLRALRKRRRLARVNGDKDMEKKIEEMMNNTYLKFNKACNQ